MKKIAILLLALVMVLSMAACSSAEETKDPNGLASNPQGNPSGGPAGNPSDPAGSSGPAATQPPHTSHTFDENGQCTECDAKVSVGLKYEFHDKYCDDDCYDYHGDDHYVVAGIGSCKDIDIVIPDYYNGLPVRAIDARAFREQKNFRSIEIPNTVTRIGEWAFEDCTSLTSVTIPDGVTTIETKTFEGCTNLTSVIIPDGVTKIKNFAFYRCEKLRSVVLGNSVCEIGYATFKNCRSLTNIAIPASVTSIDSEAFTECGIKEIYISDLSAWCRIEFGKERVYNRPHWNLYLNGQLVTELVIPENVLDFTTAFRGCESITAITIPDTVIRINQDAFTGCPNLMKINYEGTKEQWNAFNVTYTWRENYTVYCTDGEIKKGE